MASEFKFLTPLSSLIEEMLSTTDSTFIQPTINQLEEATGRSENSLTINTFRSHFACYQ